MAAKKESGIDRRKFLKTTSTLGAGLALGATSCGSDGKGDAQSSAQPSGKDSDGPKAEPPANKNATGGTGEKKLDGAPAVVPADSLVEQVNVVVIGCGMQGEVLIESTFKDKLPGVRFKAVCDIWEHNRIQKRNVLTRVKKHDVMEHAYEDYRELLDQEKDLDAAIIATPDWMHAEHAIACMKAGLHVYCEKEMSNDLTKAHDMVRTSRETGRLLQIGHQRRSSPRYVFAHDKIFRETGILGVLTHAYAQWNRSTVNSQPIGITKNKKARPKPDILKKYGYGSITEFLNWRWYRKYGGGPICDLGSHQIDVLGWFLGSLPTRVVVDGGKDYWRKQNTGYEWYDNVRAIYHFPGSGGTVRAQYQVLTTTSALGYYESFMGTNGTLSISESPTRCRLYAEGYLPADEEGRHPWQQGASGQYFKMDKNATKREPPVAASGGMADLLKIYKPSPPPVQFLFNLTDNSTAHGPHLRNFFNAVRGKEKLNCPGEVGYECAVQVLKVNQILDAGKDSGTFEEKEFKV